MSIFINGNPASGLPASYPSNRVTYDNTSSGLTADDVQGAIDEVVGDIPNMTNVAYKNASNQFSAEQTIDAQNGTTTSPGSTYLTLGNDTPDGTEGNSRGVIRLYGNSSFYTGFRAPNPSANRDIRLPDANGIVALTSDLTPTAVDMSGVTVTTASNRFSLIGVRAFVVGKMFFLSGWIGVATGTAYGNASGSVELIKNLPFTVSQGKSISGITNKTGLTDIENYAYLTFTGNEIKLDYTVVQANVNGRIWFDTCVAIQ